MMLSNAFNFALKLTETPCTITRTSYNAADIVINAKVSISNYFRNRELMEEVTTKGREYIISTKYIGGSALVSLQKGDIINIPKYGSFSIVEVREMNGLGGEVLGYRVRAD